MNSRKSLCSVALISQFALTACGDSSTKEDTTTTVTATATTTNSSPTSSSASPMSMAPNSETSIPAPAPEQAPAPENNESQPQVQNFIAPPPAPAPEPAPAYEPPAAPVAPSTNFSSCKEALAAGYSHITAGSPGYSTNLDRDGDAIACDKVG